MRYKPWLFILLTFIFTWSIEIPAALYKHGLSGAKIPNGLQTFSTLAPGIVAIFLSLVFGGIKNLKKFLFQLIITKRPIKWYVISIFTGIFITGFSLLIFSWILNHFYTPDNISNLFFLFLILFFFSPLWEELGWRGYLLPSLGEKISPLKSSLIIGCIWGLWHLPIYMAINPFGDETFKFFIFIFIGCFPLSIIQTWIYNSTKGSLLFCILFHDSVNVGVTYFFSNIKGNEMRPFEISVGLFIVIAGIILYRTKGLLGDRKNGVTLD